MPRRAAFSSGLRTFPQTTTSSTHRSISVPCYLAAATQTFRDLFRSQVIEATEGIGVRDVALLFTDLKGSTELYDRIGDLNAYSQVQRHFECLMDVTIRHRGAAIKTIGDAVMAAFLKSADAVEPALEMRKVIEQFNEIGRAHV